MAGNELIDDHVSEPQCKLAVNALLKHALNFQEKKAANELLPGKEQSIWLVLAVRLMHPEKKLKPVKIPIVHPLVDPRISSVCLITKDPQREYKDLLEQHNVRFISRVVGIDKLKGKFKPFEARRMLLKENDLFLADERVVPLLPSLLGKIFFKAKKQPIPVCLTRKDLKVELERAIESTYFHQNQGTCTSVKIGTLSHKPSQILDNLKTALPAVVKQIKGQWDNVQSFHIKTSSSASLPIWTCDLGAESGARWAGLAAGDSSGNENGVEEDSGASADEDGYDEAIARSAVKSKGKKEGREEKKLVKGRGEREEKGKKRVAESEAEKPKKKAKAGPAIDAVGSRSANAVVSPTIDAPAQKAKHSEARLAGSRKNQPPISATLVSTETSNSAAEEKQVPAAADKATSSREPRKKASVPSSSDTQTIAAASSTAPATQSETVASKAPTGAATIAGKTARASAGDFFEDEPSQTTQAATETTDAQPSVEAKKRKRRAKTTEADSLLEKADEPAPPTKASEKVPESAAPKLKKHMSKIIDAQHEVSPAKTDSPAKKGYESVSSAKANEEAAEGTPAKSKKHKTKTKAAVAQSSTANTPAPAPSGALSTDELKTKRTREGLTKKKAKVLQSAPAVKSAKHAIVGEKRL